MNDVNSLSLIDVDNLVQKFLTDYDRGIRTIHRINLKKDSQLSLQSFIADVTQELRTGCVTFINNNSSLEGLFPYMFYITNAYAKRQSFSNVKKITEYLCPGCLYLGRENLITLEGVIFKCDECKASLKASKTPGEEAFYRTFSIHNKKGYKCPECNRFIPHPLYDGASTISCPYFDCCFVGDIHELKNMHHPSSQSNPEKLVTDINIFADSNNDNNALSKLEKEEELSGRIKLLYDIIESQRNSAPYSGANFTLIHKVATYQAFLNLLGKHPEDISEYLLYPSRHAGFQSKIFQEYVSILESSLPICYKKGKTLHRVESLLDPNMNIFDGISVFDAVITDKLEIKNGTKEFYIGSRKAYYTKPFYIGKVLSIIDKNTKKPLIDFITEYSFSKIKMKDIEPNTEVTVTHLRIPPHYQMGGMVYINRARKKIVDRAKSVLEKLNAY